MNVRAQIARKRKVEEALKKARFIYAKSMPHVPHHYTMKKEWNDDALFDLVVRFIREYGVPEMYGRHKRFYYYFGGYHYWTMGAPVEETILINRERNSRKESLK